VKLPSVLRRVRETFLQAVWPVGAVCLSCDQISDGEPLCPACRHSLQYEGILSSWDFRTIDGVRVWSMREHTGIPRDLVLSLKHGTCACAADALMLPLRNRPEAFTLPAGTIVTWVPMPAVRKRERCIDHGRILAEAAAKELGLECRPLLIRLGNGRTQATLSGADREKNLANAFAPAEKIDSPVLLVDDVLTTGTTIRRCADALRAGGAADITALTMTHASL